MRGSDDLAVARVLRPGYSRRPLQGRVADQTTELLTGPGLHVRSPGYRKVIDYLRGFGVVVAVAVEGTGSYGAELARILRRAGMTVLEVARPDRRARQVRPARRVPIWR